MSTDGERGAYLLALTVRANSFKSPKVLGCFEPKARHATGGKGD
ncbi:MAG TPA: hypothetical protein VFA77_07810 [Candidatus Eisenbacteria bacterium]|nr:hypothetical protein [Candidatus Eisenbacteria bacterium]